MMTDRQDNGDQRDHYHPQHAGQADTCEAWIMTTRRPGDKVAGWVVECVFEDKTRWLEQSERCEVTSFCYPSGARMVRARLAKPS